MATATLAVAPSPLAIFRNRNFSLLWSGELISTIGDSLTSLAASILVYRMTNSALSVGLMLMATAAPSLILGLIAGVFVDRYDRKRIMIAADIARALLVFLIPVLVPLNIGWLYVIVMLTSCLAQFFNPAHASVIPEVTTDRELAAANSLLSISSFGSTAVGFAASGLIASQFPIAWAFYIDALTFLASAACLAAIRIAPLAASGEKTSVAAIFRNMRGGFQSLWQNPILRSFFLISPLIGMAFGLWNTLLLPFARQALQATEFEYGLQEGLTSVGFVIGSLLMIRVAERLREGQWVAISLIGMGLVYAVYSQMTSVPVAILFVMISGVANAPSAVARGLLIQRNTPRAVRGRVNSVFGVTRSVAFIVGMGIAGLADIWGVRIVGLVAALLVLIPGVLALVLPGLGQPAAEWRRALELLRSASRTSQLGPGRAATRADFDALAMRLPALADLSAKERRNLAAQSCVVDVATGATILSSGQLGDQVYFILTGSAIAGIEIGQGHYRSLETMRAGDFFGEIAVLMAGPRTANVVAEEPSTLIEVPAVAFRQMMQNPMISRLVHTKFFERMARTNLNELPRFAGVNPQDLRELRQASDAS